jgi:hypothetical protein
MSHSRSGSLSAPGYHRTRSNSQSRIESAISAIQQRGENVDAPGAFIPGTGGFIGGPPTAGAVDHGAVIATGISPRGASVRHRKDLTHHIFNGKRVKTTERICNDVGGPHPEIVSKLILRLSRFHPRPLAILLSLSSGRMPIRRNRVPRYLS